MNSSKKKLVWACALAVSLVLSILAAFSGGYIGPDYPTPFERLIDSSKLFDPASTNPPGYYLIGYAIFKIVGPRNAFPITLSILQAVVNTLALWWFFIYSERRFGSSLVQVSFALFVALLPVRVIHATTLGTDCMTIPLFVLALFAFEKLLSDPTATPPNAIYLGLVLGIANFIKYSFMALIPAAFVLLAFIAWNRRWRFSRFVVISMLALALPCAIAGASFYTSSTAHGYNTEKHWAKPGIPPDMNFSDLLSVKRSDAHLFRAPEYFKREILFPHKHSYLGLSHMATFTDSMNIFQDLSVPQRFGSILIPDQKTRKPWKIPIMQASMTLGAIWTLLALAGTAWTLWQAINNLFRNRLDRESVLSIFATAFFLLMFLPIPFVHGGALFGYWTPRLILPALLYFFWAAFLLVDNKIAREQPLCAVTTLLLTLVQCALSTLILV